MSEYKRFKRIIKSVIPRFPQGGERNYSHDDAKMIINDLGLAIPPKVLAKMLESNTLLEDFINHLYHLEADIRKRVVNEFSVIDPKFEPKVHNEDGMLGFTVRHKGEEIVFVEYRIKKRNESTENKEAASETGENPKKPDTDEHDDLKHSGI